MNVRRISAASRTILAAQKNGVRLAATLAMALEAEQLLQFPEDGAELIALRARGTELEKDTAAPAVAEFTPGAVLVALAMALREQPTGAQVLDGLDELGELVVCDGDPAEIATWVTALQYLLDTVTPESDAAPPVVIYRAEHADIVAGLYTTPQAAQQHCEALVSREYPDTAPVLFEWSVDRADPAGLELDISVDGAHLSTGYTVTPLEVATVFDPDADE